MFQTFSQAFSIIMVLKSHCVPYLRLVFLVHNNNNNNIKNKIKKLNIINEIRESHTYTRGLLGNNIAVIKVG